MDAESWKVSGAQKVTWQPECYASDHPAGKGCDLHARHEQRTQERRGVLADASLAQVHDQHLAVVHETSQVQAVPRLADDVAQELRADELPDPVLDRSDRERVAVLRSVSVANKRWPEQ